MFDQETWTLLGQFCERYGWPDTEENRIRAAEVVLSHLVATGELVKDGYIIRTAEEDFRPN